MKNILLSLVAALVLAVGAGRAYAFDLGLNAHADLNVRTNEYGNVQSDESAKEWSFSSGITGTVTAVNSTSITVQGKNDVTYTVDLSNAKIRKDGATVDTSKIAVGDTVFVQGAANGTTIVATAVLDAKAKSDIEKSANAKDLIAHSGMIGVITAVNSNSITLLGKNGTTYTVTFNGAKIWKDKKETTSASALSIGDTIIVQGSMSGSNIDASAIYKVTLPKPSVSAGIQGTVTAITGSTFTLLGSDGKYYIVTTDNASVTGVRGDSEHLSNIKIGDSVVVKGSISGTTIDASTIVDARLGHGFFTRFGLFLRNLFGKKGN